MIFYFDHFISNFRLEIFLFFQFLYLCLYNTWFLSIGEGNIDKIYKHIKLTNESKVRTKNKMQSQTIICI